MRNNKTVQWPIVNRFGFPGLSAEGKGYFKTKYSEIEIGLGSYRNMCIAQQRPAIPIFVHQYQYQYQNMAKANTNTNTNT